MYKDRRKHDKELQNSTTVATSFSCQIKQLVKTPLIVKFGQLRIDIATNYMVTYVRKTRSRK